ncbi:MAG: hypothetical protein CMLOHMNK_00615 [Steroidobacteraceae bacterium]|nr:hypothetical protein [Steroidobacteraceae bacterium]
MNTHVGLRSTFRFALVAILVVVSLIPVILTFLTLGDLNLWYSIAIWLLFIGLLAKRSRYVVIGSAALLAVALTFQPIPNWLSISNEGDVRVRFIGFSALQDTAAVVIGLWVFQCLVLLGVATLLKRPVLNQSPLG